MATAALALLLLQALVPWSDGELDIHHISTGRGNATLFVLPDGTSVDAGARPEQPEAPSRPSNARRPGEWVACYVARTLPEPKLDYVLITHFHGDHMGGLADVASALEIGKVLDRGWPDYDYPRPLEFESIRAYRRVFVVSDADERGTVLAEHGPYRSQ